MLLEAGADVNKVDLKGMTPLFYCATYGARLVYSPERLRLLLEAGADVNHVDENGQSVLHHFGSLGKSTSRGSSQMQETALEECVCILLQGEADINTRDNEGMTPLHVTAREGNDVLLRYFLDGGADVYARDKNGRTPLYYASAESRHVLLKACVAGAGNLLTIVGVLQADLLETIISLGYEKKVLLLPNLLQISLVCKAFHTIVFSFSSRPEFSSAKSDLKGLGRLRLAELKDLDEELRVRLYCFLHSYGGPTREFFNWISKVVKREGQWAMVQLFKEAGSELLNGTNKDGCSLLYYACFEDCPCLEAHVFCVTCLLKAGADLNTFHPLREEGPERLFGIRSLDAEGLSPLHIAAACSLGCLRAILQHYNGSNVDLNIASKLGRTPLHIAADGNEHECLELLIAAGADIRRADNYGRMPLHYAHGKSTLLLLRAGAGADVNTEDDQGKTPLLVLVTLTQPNIRRYAYTQIHRRTESLDPTTFRALFDAGAIVMHADKQGKTVFHYMAASFDGYERHDIIKTKVIECFRIVVLQAYLQQAVRDLNVLDDYPRQTPLHCCATTGNLVLVRILLEAGASLHVKDMYGRTPLYNALMGGHIECLGVLWKAVGANYAEDGLPLALWEVCDTIRCNK